MSDELNGIYGVPISGNNFQYNPNYAQQPQQAAPAGTAQQAPQSQSATTDGKTVNVEANFKA